MKDLSSSYPVSLANTSQVSGTVSPGQGTAAQTGPGSEQGVPLPAGFVPPHLPEPTASGPQIPVSAVPDIHPAPANDGAGSWVTISDIPSFGG